MYIICKEILVVASFILHMCLQHILFSVFFCILCVKEIIICQRKTVTRSVN